MAQMTLSTLRITPESTKETSFRYLEGNYGDGYISRRQDGISPLNIRWNVTTPNMPADEAEVLEAEIAALGAGYFSWQAPDETAATNWVLDPISWQRNYASTDKASISFSVKRFYI